MSYKVYLERYLFILIEEHVELADADPQVSIREPVWDVEAESSKLSPLKSNSMEDTQREQ